MATGASVLLLLVGFSVYMVGSVTCQNGEHACCKSGRTRAGKETCRGPIFPLSEVLCRVAQVPSRSYACLFHSRDLEKKNNRCSCPLAAHSSALSKIPIPARLYMFFDELGATQKEYRPGTRWCSACRNAFKKEEETHKHTLPSYIPPKKRSRPKVNRKPNSVLNIF